MEGRAAGAVCHVDDVVAPGLPKVGNGCETFLKSSPTFLRFCKVVRLLLLFLSNVTLAVLLLFLAVLCDVM